MSPVTIVGAGWAGLSAAVELAAAGVPVTLLEAARQAGGRARRVDWQGMAIDNGQHLMIGAYTTTLALLARLGSLPGLESRPLRLAEPGFALRLPDLPAPWHLALGLLGAQGLGWRDKLAAARFMQAQQRRQFRLDGDTTVTELLDHYRQPAQLTRRLWEPLCLAALNTPMAKASAQVFLNVLRDSLGGGAAASRAVFNRVDLGRLLPDAALHYLERHGGTCRFSSRVTGIRREAGGFRLMGVEHRAERLLLAVHPAAMPRLLSELPELAPLAQGLAGYRWQPILTCWLRFAARIPLPYPMTGLGGEQSPWVFERDDIAPGMLAVVISAEGPHLDQPPAALKASLLARLTALTGPLPPLLAWKIIVEKRATFACLPHLPRPQPRTELPGLYLAGDYIDPDYPATLEGAVRSGVKCAKLILEDS